jgi:arsenate reductase
MDLYPSLSAYLSQHEQGPPPALDRQPLLAAIRAWMQAKDQAGRPMHLLFVCVHNSRRSFLGECLAKAILAYYNRSDIQTHSAGGEATACNERTVAVLQRIGFQITATGKLANAGNPIYEGRVSDSHPPFTLFSKDVVHTSLPTQNVLAITVCSNDPDGATCPWVPGAELRLPLPYTDPKFADGTPNELAAYDTAAATIARELLWTFQPFQQR